MNINKNNLVVRLNFKGLENLKEINTGRYLKIETACTGRLSVDVEILQV